MKKLFLATLLFASTAFAQAPMGQSSPSIADLDQQLQEVGCRAERSAAAQTIVQLQKQISDLKAQLEKLDPPKSGATKK